MRATLIQAMEDKFIYVNGILTHIVTFGDALNKSQNEIIVCVTGNPGLPGFYEPFGSHLHTETQLPVCLIGHTGHEMLTCEKSNTLEKQENLFSLQGQVDHKLAFVNEYLKGANKIHFIGHSIGAWIINEMCNKEDIFKRTVSINFLFPTLQHMVETPYGRKMSLLRKLHFLILLLIRIFYFLPVFIKKLLINIYLNIYGIDHTLIDTIIKYLNPTVMNKVIFLAHDEMACVRELNVEAVNKNKELINVVYSEADGWAPVHYFVEMKRLVPTLRMLSVDHDHSFVLKSSKPIADIVAKYVREASYERKAA